jgi:hypothetical protein
MCDPLCRARTHPIHPVQICDPIAELPPPIVHRPPAEVMQQWVAAVQPSMADRGLTPIDGGHARGRGGEGNGARSQ